MKDKNMKYVLENYNKKSTFSSFLPGLSGVKGIPLWCFYVNRGQGVVSFGSKDKDNAIMEFYPAYLAYKNVKTTGFRTFIKNNGVVREAFANADIPHKMSISMNKLEISEEAEGLETCVTYFTLPNENVGALVRKVSITNTSKESVNLEIIDGMPMLLPFGLTNELMKTIGQTAKAWMQVEDVDAKTPYYRVRASLKDSATVTEVTEGNFSCAFLHDGTKLPAIVDPDVVFSYDNSLETPVMFKEKSIDEILELKQVTQNQLPSSFYAVKSTLESGKNIVFYEVIGQVSSKKVLQKFLEKDMDSVYFDLKESEALNVVDNLCAVIDTKTANEKFDAYTKYTYMDNVLRGGHPVLLGKDKIFYVYARKHGDIERDYNFFALLPEYYSQGNGNFRDVNQNRRLDNFFSPYLGTENIKMFYDLIQFDGYNPLLIEKVSYNMSEENIETITKTVDIKDVLSKEFTPGSVLKKLEDLGISSKESEEILENVMNLAEKGIGASFGEGYWSDHWTYNLDLIESFLEIYPEKEENLLFAKNSNYFLGHAKVNPRKKRYEVTKNGVRQYHSVDEENTNPSDEKLTKMANGDVATSTLLEKLVLLNATKFAALDFYGLGVEMEGGKPGWYDALNGLPGLFGSSMCETYELCRNLEYTIAVLEKYPKEIELFEEVNDLVVALNEIVKNNMNLLMNDTKVMKFWNEINDVKEVYREKVFKGIDGNVVTKTADEMLEILKNFHKVVKKGIEKAFALNDGKCPTYFYFDVTDYKKDDDGIEVLDVELQKVPLFLEGPVRYLKLENSLDTKENLYNSVKNSGLFDEKLSMYKVNDSLKDASFEIGRAKAFTPGWLENESIWLHMEYKYLLELIKNGLYENFFNDFEKACVPFLDEEVYGRSILENSSFIASSANPNENIHGKGFVARLSGSTIEFLQMWKLMMFGKNIFTYEDNKLVLTLSPSIPKYLIGDNLEVSSTLLSSVKVTYKFDKKANFTPKNSAVTKYELKYFDGSVCEVTGKSLVGKFADDVRENKIENIIVSIKGA